MSLAVSSDTHALLCSLERGFSCQPFKTSMFTCLLIVPSWTEACRVWQVLGVRIASRSRMAGDFIDTHSWVCLEFFFFFLSFCIFQLLSHFNKKIINWKMQLCYRQTVFKSEYFKVNFIFLKASIFFLFLYFSPLHPFCFHSAEKR